MDNIPESAKANVDAKYDRPVWYLSLPAFKYVEDVKKLARDNGLRIIDANVTSDRTGECKEPPAVTLRPEFAPKVATAPAVDPAPVDPVPLHKGKK